MANALGRILLVGNDRAAMGVRGAVLEHFWPVEIRTLDAWPQDAIPAELVVLCGSVPEPDRQAWVDRIRAQAPQILLVRMNGYDAGPRAGADATVDERHGPGALVSTIYELLTERGLASRSWSIVGEPLLLH